jgi:rsbT antagonist protein RsbS
MEEGNRVPIIRVWGLLLVPVQGDLGDSQAEALKHEVLTAIHSTSIRGLVLDVTGLWLIDSHLCAVLTRLAQAASLMGTRTVVCGMSAEIALTIQMMGLEIEAVQTALSLEQAFQEFGVQGPELEEDAAGDALAAELAQGES